MDIKKDCELCEHCERMTEREQKLKTSLITRLNRVEGQVRGIKGMIERDSYCDDVLNQIAAAQAALDSVSKLVLESHIKGCLVKKIRNGEDDIVDELITTIGKLLK
ncbi:MAG: CsoR family transcriptional regulator [Oscillospiraceae bacterium]|nr:CsoR family transcriptional regulator [Oscillospiraceae bacterium]